MAALFAGCGHFLSQQLAHRFERIKNARQRKPEYGEGFETRKPANQHCENLLGRRSDASVLPPPQGMYDSSAPPPPYEVVTKGQRQSQQTTGNPSNGPWPDAITLHTKGLREEERIEGRDMAAR